MAVVKSFVEWLRQVGKKTGLSQEGRSPEEIAALKERRDQAFKEHDQRRDKPLGRHDTGAY
jgi:hypothetical protein